MGDAQPSCPFSCIDWTCRRDRSGYAHGAWTTGPTLDGVCACVCARAPVMFLRASWID